MTVALILKEKGPEVISVRSDQKVIEALEILKERRIGAVLVCDDGDQICGVLSERDVVRELPNHGGDLLNQTVSVLMTHDVITCAPGDSISDIMALMTRNRIRHLPVVEGGSLCGMISIGDVVKQKIAESEHEAEALKAYIATG